MTFPYERMLNINDYGIHVKHLVTSIKCGLFLTQSNYNIMPTKLGFYNIKDEVSLMQHW